MSLVLSKGDNRGPLGSEYVQLCLKHLLLDSRIACFLNLLGSWQQISINKVMQLGQLSCLVKVLYREAPIIASSAYKVKICDQCWFKNFDADVLSVAPCHWNITGIQLLLKNSYNCFSGPGSFNADSRSTSLQMSGYAVSIIKRLHLWLQEKRP